MDRLAHPLLPMATPAPSFDPQRRVHALLGLPFDAMGLDDAVRHIRDAALAGRRCSFVTPNLNWLIASRRDAALSRSVRSADLSLVDGMPLVWMARALGLPIRERVAGADVFEALAAHPPPALAVYFFGGVAGAAAAAAGRLNATATGLVCVGHDEGGFGSVEALSSDSHIDRINASGAHFVVVALGAQKGQAWIERNAARLQAPVLAHLGAVVNFAGGTLRRAPRALRRIGLEWAWRIREEPALWRRYRDDGLAAARLACGSVAPEAMLRLRPERAGAPAALQEGVDDPGGAARTTSLSLSGAWRGADLGPLRAALAGAAARGDRLHVDLSGATSIDAASLGLLLIAEGAFEGAPGFAAVGARGAVAATLDRHGVLSRWASHVR